MESLQLDQATLHGARTISLNPNYPRLVAQQGENADVGGPGG